MNFKGSGDLHKLWVRDILNKSLPIFTGKKGTSKADVAGSSLTGVFGSLGYTPPSTEGAICHRVLTQQFFVE